MRKASRWGISCWYSWKYRHYRGLVRRRRLDRLQVAAMTVGLRVPEEQEREGLDVNSHGENAYNA